MEENIKLYMQYRKNYYERMRLIKQRVEEGKKIRVGFFVQSLSSLYSLRDNAVIENLAIDYIIVSNCDTLLDADGFL